MEFGLDQLRTGMRPGSSYLDISTYWFAAGLSQIPLCYPGNRPGSRPAASWNLAYHALPSSRARASRSATSLGPVFDQDSIMEFGFKESHVKPRAYKNVHVGILIHLPSIVMAAFHVNLEQCYPVFLFHLLWKKTFGISGTGHEFF